MAERRMLIAGNWKMNGLAAALGEVAGVSAAAVNRPDLDVLLCPPATLISAMAQSSGRQSLAIGAQDCHAQTSGAHTGDISAEMLADAGATYAIVGHSERRSDHGEQDATVKAKAEAALRAGLVAIVCVGETAGQRAWARTLPIVQRQVQASLPSDATPSNTVVAYEPVWAIGTGLTPTPDDAQRVHAAIRETLIETLGNEAGNAMRLLYGGSVKGANAAELLSLPDVDGALVGGASLKATDFGAIIAAAPDGAAA